MTQRTHHGFSLVEVSLAMIILSVAILSTLLLLSSGLRWQGEARFKILAAFHAATIVESLAQPTEEFNGIISTQMETGTDTTMRDPYSSIAAGPWPNQHSLDPLFSLGWNGEILERTDKTDSIVHRLQDNGNTSSFGVWGTDQAAAPSSASRLMFFQPHLLFSGRRDLENAAVRAGVLAPLPDIMSQRLARANPDMARVLDHGGRLYYLAGEGISPDVRKLVFGVQGAPQQNVLHHHPAVPLRQAIYPFPPRASSKSLPRQWMQRYDSDKVIGTNPPITAVALPTRDGVIAGDAQPTWRGPLFAREVPTLRYLPHASTTKPWFLSEGATDASVGWPDAFVGSSAKPVVYGPMFNNNDGDDQKMSGMAQTGDLIALGATSQVVTKDIFMGTDRFFYQMDQIRDWESAAMLDSMRATGAATSPWLLGIHHMRRLAYWHWNRIQAQMNTMSISADKKPGSPTIRRVPKYRNEREDYTVLVPVVDYSDPSTPKVRMVSETRQRTRVVQDGFKETVGGNSATLSTVVLTGIPAPAMGLPWIRSLAGTDLLYVDHDTVPVDRVEQLQIGLPNLERRVMYRTAALALWARVKPTGPVHIMTAHPTAIASATPPPLVNPGTSTVQGDPNIADAIASLPTIDNPLLGIMPFPEKIHPAQVLALSYLAHAAVLVTGYRPPFIDDQNTVDPSDDVNLCPNPELPYKALSAEQYYLVNPYYMSSVQYVAATKAPSMAKMLLREPLPDAEWLLEPRDKTDMPASIPIAEPTLAAGQSGAARRLSEMVCWVHGSAGAQKPVLVRRMKGPVLNAFPGPYADTGAYDHAGKPLRPLYKLGGQPRTSLLETEINGDGSLEILHGLDSTSPPMDTQMAAYAMENALRWAQRFAATNPYDMRVPRPLNRQTGFHQPLYVLDIFGARVGSHGSSPAGSFLAEGANALRPPVFGGNPWPAAMARSLNPTEDKPVKTIQINAKEQIWPHYPVTWGGDQAAHGFERTVLASAWTFRDWASPESIETRQNHENKSERGVIRKPDENADRLPNHHASGATPLGVYLSPLVLFAPLGGPMTAVPARKPSNARLNATDVPNAWKQAMVLGDTNVWGYYHHAAALNWLHGVGGGAPMAQPTSTGVSAQTYPLTGFIGGSGGDMQQGRVDPPALSSQARNRWWPSQPFTVQDRTRQLVVWMADWMAYEDAETLPSAPPDASEVAISPLLDWGQNNTPRKYGIVTRHGAPEAAYTWANPLRDMTMSRLKDGYLAPDELGKPGSASYAIRDSRLFLDAATLPGYTPATAGWTPRSWRYDYANPYIQLGFWGADRNRNGVCDRGSVSPAVDMRSIEVGRFVFYDPVLTTDAGL
jgi:prepilin-type N-terminal cleavage/methylation domain-containing protein